LALTIPNYGWLTSEATTTSLEKQIQNHTTNLICEPWTPETKNSFQYGLIKIVKNYYDITNANNDLALYNQDIVYILDNTAKNDIYYGSINNGSTTISINGDHLFDHYKTSTAATNDYITLITSKPLTKEEKIRQQLRQKLMPQLLFRRFGVGKSSKDSEKKAREALRAIIGDIRFRRYLKHGFITIKGQSGLIYQVFPGTTMTRVWKEGKPLEKLCVVFCDSSVPPTDSVIMRLLMILDSEEEFRKQAHTFTFNKTEARQPIPNRIAA